MRAHLGTISVFAFVVIVGACGEDNANTNSPVTTAPAMPTRRTTTPAIIDTTVSDTQITTPASAQTATTSTPTTGAAVSASPSPAVATAAFDAWMARDLSRVAFSVDPAVTELMSRRALEPDGWEGPTCDAAAGSTYCSWVSANASVVLWLANQAGGGKVMGVTFGPPPGGLAVWPMTTMEQAENAQQSVDDGHSPWQLDPDAVALSYAENVLGFEQPEVEHTPLNVRVIDTSGIAISMHMVQPARLYLVELPEGSTTRVLAIAVMATEARFDEVLAAAAPIIASIEFHPEGTG